MNASTTMSMRSALRTTYCAPRRRKPPWRLNGRRRQQARWRKAPTRSVSDEWTFRDGLRTPFRHSSRRSRCYLPSCAGLTVRRSVVPVGKPNAGSNHLRSRLSSANEPPAQPSQPWPASSQSIAPPCSATFSEPRPSRRALERASGLDGHHQSPAGHSRAESRRDRPRAISRRARCQPPLGAGI